MPCPYYCPLKITLKQERQQEMASMNIKCDCEFTSWDIVMMDHPSEVIVAYLHQHQQVQRVVDRSREAII